MRERSRKLFDLRRSLNYRKLRLIAAFKIILNATAQILDSHNVALSKVPAIACDSYIKAETKLNYSINYRDFTTRDTR